MSYAGIRHKYPHKWMSLQHILLISLQCNRARLQFSGASPPPETMQHSKMPLHFQEEGPLLRTFHVVVVTLAKTCVLSWFLVQ